MNRQQRRVKHKLTGEELEKIKRDSVREGIKHSVKLFEKVMNEEFGFGPKRMGRVAAGIYKELKIDPSELDID